MNRSSAFGLPSFHFQRAGGRLQVRKPRRKIPLRFRLVAALLGGTALFFLAAYEIHGFLISWPRLEVRDVRILCGDPGVRALIEDKLAGARWGNILLLDLGSIRTSVEEISWVKHTRVRKQFPSAVIVEAAPRRPAVLVERGAILLVDRDGAVLEPSSREARPDLPLVTDAGGFARDFEARVRLAVACLEDLPAEDRARIDRLDVTDLMDVVLTFKGSPTRLRLGDAQFGARTAEYLRNKDRWEREFGELESVHLWFADRVILKPVRPAGAGIPAPRGNPAAPRMKEAE